MGTLLAGIAFAVGGMALAVFLGIVLCKEKPKS
jgi:hypothetical protein